MRAPSATDLLLAWERGLDQSPTRRALALLAAAFPEISTDKLAALPIGIRDARLLSLRESLFGDAVTAVSQCPQCGEKLDVAFNIDDVYKIPADKVDMKSTEFGVQTHELHADGYDITYRVPTSADLLGVPDTSEDIALPHALLQRCVINVQQNGTVISVDTVVSTLPDAVIAAISQDMAEADPQAQIELGLTCPECHHTWHALFDIAAFLWSEIQAWAHRMLQDVHTLARAYGWREADILAMSARRREIYLELARS